MGMRFAEGAPVFAVEVRSENDYGPAAARAIPATRRSTGVGKLPKLNRLYLGGACL